MSDTSLDIEALLAPVSEANPSGADLEYDTQSIRLEALARGTPEQRIGESVKEGVGPDWPAVKETAIELLRRSKDLRVAMFLTISSLAVDGLPGLRDGLSVVSGLIDRYWDTMHPRLDPDDDNDPLQRLNLISAVSPAGSSAEDPMQFRDRAQTAPLTDSSKHGKFRFRDQQIASGERPPPANPDVRVPKMAEIEASFDDTPLPKLERVHNAIVESSNLIAKIEASLDERVGATRAPDLGDFRKVLGEIGKSIEKRLGKRKPNLVPIEAGGEMPKTDEIETSAVSPARGNGVIGSQQDVVVAIDRICAYYEREEPSSPIPLMLKRAQRLVGKSFMEILQDLSPATVTAMADLVGQSAQPTSE